MHIRFNKANVEVVNLQGRGLMPGNLYKYFGPQVIDLVLTDDGATIKLSKPEDFNDPYELFLTVDYGVDASALAAYQELVGNIDQLPTTCFSNSPAVVPMWAHYGVNGSGFVIEFEEECLVDEFPKSLFKDVTYRDSADDELTEMLYRAHVIGKPRYTYFLRNGVFFGAYFTKANCWSYELERRMVVTDESEVRSCGDIILADVPKHCIRSLIAGAKATPDIKGALKERAKSLSCSYYEARIGRSSITPFFTDLNGYPHVFKEGRIEEADQSCEECSEPTLEGNDRCSWCQISDDDRRGAAISNPYRMLHSYGRLNDYIKQMDAISARVSSRKRSSDK